MKKSIIIAIMFMLSLVGFTSCEKESVDVTTVSETNQPINVPPAWCRDGWVHYTSGHTYQWVGCARGAGRGFGGMVYPLNPADDQGVSDWLLNTTVDHSQDTVSLEANMRFEMIRDTDTIILYTGEGGHLELDDIESIPEGNYTVNVSCEGFKPESKSVQFPLVTYEELYTYLEREE